MRNWNRNFPTALGSNNRPKSEAGYREKKEQTMRGLRFGLPE
jgi:hypothetical protein